MRDDLLGVFGTPDATGKPGDGDLTQHKATTVVIAARQLADPAARRELDTLLSAPVAGHSPVPMCVGEGDMPRGRAAA